LPALFGPRKPVTRLDPTVNRFDGRGLAIAAGLGLLIVVAVGHLWTWSARPESPAAVPDPSTFVIDSIEVVALAFESVRPNSCCRGPEAFRP
jgi:hypothetical protein